MPTPTPAPAPAAPKQEEKKFQHYHCSRVSTTLITPNNKRIPFAKFEFITDDEDIMEYLDAEIAGGIGIITKGKLLTHEEADPMEVLKQKHIAEYLAARGEQAPARNMGKTVDAPKAKVVTSDQVAN